MNVFLSEKKIKRYTYWYIRCKVDGQELKPIILPNGTTEAEAQRQLKAVLAQIAEGLDPFGAQKNLDEWLTEYLDWIKARKAPGTVEDEGDCLNRWLRRHKARFPAIKRPDQIKLEHLEEWQTDYLKTAAPRTVNKSRSYLINLFNWSSGIRRKRRGRKAEQTTTRRKYTTGNPAAELERMFEPDPETPSLSIDQLKALRAHLSLPMFELAFLLHYNSGVRPSNLAALRPGDFDFENSQIWLRKTKTGTHRPVYIDPAVMNECEAALAARAVIAALSPLPMPEYLLSHRRGYGPLTEDTWRDELKRAGKKANVNIKGGHTMRHTMATHLAEQGESLEVIQERLDHRSITTTRRYVKVNKERQIRAASRLKTGELLGVTSGVNPKDQNAK